MHTVTKGGGHATPWNKRKLRGCDPVGLRVHDVVQGAVRSLAAPVRVSSLLRVKRNPNFPRYGNRKFPTRFTLRPLRYERGRPSISP